MLIKVDNKEKTVRNAIEIWLRDERIYCNNCDVDYGDKPMPCCEDPQIGRNVDHCRGVIKQNKAIRDSRKNAFASNDDKTIRWGLSLPPKLLQFLDVFFKTYTIEKQGIFKEEGELVWFARKFPQFAIPERL